MASSSSTTQKILFALVPALVLVLLGGGGVLLGRHLAIRKIATVVNHQAHTRTVGSLLRAENLHTELHLSYKDPADALANLDHYSWVPQNIPAPFVGSAPMPDNNSRVTINSMGFRCDHELMIPKPPDLCRIFITGGSTAYGAGAPDLNRTIGGFLQALLNRELGPPNRMSCEVIVAANPAWASTQERILIENRISELEPDLVISFSGNNDVHWGARGANVMWFRTYVDAHYRELVQVSYDLSGHPLSHDIVQKSQGFVDAKHVAERLRKNVELSAYILSRKTVPYYFMLQPTLSVSKKPLSAREDKILSRSKAQSLDIAKYFNNCYGLIRETLPRVSVDNLHFLDLSEVFDKYGEDDEIFLDSYHFGDRGNEIIARILFDTIKIPVMNIQKSMTAASNNTSHRDTR